MRKIIIAMLAALSLLFAPLHSDAAPDADKGPSGQALENASDNASFKRDYEDKEKKNTDKDKDKKKVKEKKKDKSDISDKSGKKKAQDKQHDRADDNRLKHYRRDKLFLNNHCQPCLASLYYCHKANGDALAHRFYGQSERELMNVTAGKHRHGFKNKDWIIVNKLTHTNIQAADMPII